jgi:hypothetical protein
MSPHYVNNNILQRWDEVSEIPQFQVTIMMNSQTVNTLHEGKLYGK